MRLFLTQHTEFGLPLVKAVFATLCLFIWGGGVINDFAFTFLIGILTGTYSSIFIASAFVLWWHKGNRPTIGASQVTMQNVATAKA